jgi:signal transduction histidine kinase
VTSRDDLVAFARKARHDLQNPVAAVTLALELAQDEMASGADDVDELVGRALRSAERLSEALDELPGRAAEWPLED